MPTLSLPPPPSMSEPDLLPSYTPQANADILPIYNPHNSDNHVSTYSFCQNSPSTQTITSKDPASSPSSTYQIKTFATGGFMNKKPHIIIHKTTSSSPPSYPQTPTQDSATSNTTRRFSLLPRRTSDTPPPPPSTDNPQTYSPSPTTIPFAEVRYDTHGTGTMIDYTSTFSPSPPHARKQRLELSSSQNQTLSTTISSFPRYWRPFPGNRSVLELITEDEQIVARFVSAAPSAVATPTLNGNKKKKDRVVGKGVEFGELQIVEEFCGGGERGSEGAKEEILCSAVAVVERARRRASNIHRAGVGYKQGAACGPTLGAYGGGVGC